ncbi:cell envelope biogenesis protein LolA [Sphingomonas oleivorans]|uniref:Cell envelope biogenesis protein LolA n=1 Tax=Sphingomonas oleivorans TaxID=1735121 RepID=A0A2T5G2N1_9SPHN|nr:outer membrane lipoprotein carrier protein LolA [Sphingomonas oleivorans]PTQ13404.1 cell envelope biogenesis protein LolA [Sphingomonas oleivorans]
MQRFLMAALLAAPVVVASAPAPAQTSSLQQISQHLRGVNTMTADFAQTDRNGKTLTGALTLKRPGRIRFQYQKGVPLLIVGDGKALTMIDYQVRQVSRWPIGNSPLSVLLDPSRDLSRYAKLVPSGDPNLLLLEGRDPKHPEFGTITIAFAKSASAPAGLLLQGWSVLDAQGNRSMVRLSNQRFNVPVSDKTFRWNDPRAKGPAR